MTGLKELIKRFFHILILFSLLVCSLILIYQNNNFQYSIISTTTQRFTGPVQKFANFFYRHLNYYNENEYLMQQNIALLKEKENMFIFYDDTVHPVFLDEKGKKRRIYDITSAHVVFNTINKANNYIIIDKGKKDGVIPDMAVLSPNGVAGVVSDVSENFSTVISLLNPNSRISAKILPVNKIGIVIWGDSDPSIAQIIDIPKHIMIAVGDSVVTSGFSDLFPKDVLIGSIIEKFDNPNNPFLTIKIRIATDFGNLHNVFLISNLYKPELDSLKSKFKNE